VVARGRDAADTAISTQFGNAKLARFTVITEELDPKAHWTDITGLSNNAGERRVLA
jgi:hypothetical protein